MGRYLLLWRWNTEAQWPADPSESLKLSENMLAAMDDLMLVIRTVEEDLEKLRALRAAFLDELLP